MVKEIKDTKENNKEEEVFSPLMNKKIRIALVKRNLSGLYDDDEAGTLAQGASKSFIVPLNMQGNLVDPLTKEERIFFEDELGLNLNVFNRNTRENPKANFWTTKQARVTLRKKGRSLASADIELDLNDAYEHILYKIAKVSPRVANSWKERFDTKEYEFVIIDGKVEFEEELTFTRLEDTVYDYLASIRDSKKKLFDLLRLYGTKNASAEVNFDSSTDWLYLQLRNASKKTSEVKKLYRLIKLGEKEIYSKVLLADAITVGLVEQRGLSYTLQGGQEIGSNESEAISFLEKSKNQATKMRLESAIDDFYNNK